MTYAHDNTLPTIPAWTAWVPSSPNAANTNPTVQGTADPGDTVRLYETADCSGSALAEAEATGGTFAIPVIASGGVSSLDDLLAIQANGTIEGAISGRALYDGRINLKEALSLLRESAF